MDRNQAYQLMMKMVSNPNLQRHALSVEAIMRSLCNELKIRNPNLPDSEFAEAEWAIVGLLHDADYEVTNKDPKRHTLIISEKLKHMGESDRIINAIQAHSDEIKPNRENFLERAVYGADELSGLITACALVRPDKKLSSLTLDSVLKKFPQKSFAKGAKRENILTCESHLGMPLNEFTEIALKAMQGISDQLGL